MIIYQDAQPRRYLKEESNWIWKEQVLHKRRHPCGGGLRILHACTDSWRYRTCRYLLAYWLACDCHFLGELCYKYHTPRNADDEKGGGFSCWCRSGSCLSDKYVSDSRIENLDDLITSLMREAGLFAKSWECWRSGQAQGKVRLERKQTKIVWDGDRWSSLPWRCPGDLMKRRATWMWFKWSNSEWLSRMVAIYTMGSIRSKLENLEGHWFCFCYVVAGLLFRGTLWAIQFQILRQEAKQVYVAVRVSIHIVLRLTGWRVMAPALGPADIYKYNFHY